MKKGLATLTAMAFGAAGYLSQDLNAQDAQTWESKSRNNSGEQIIITRKADTSGKMTIVVDGDKVTVNGKLVEDNDKDQDVSVNRRRIKDVGAFSFSPSTRYSISSDVKPNSAILGVTSSPAENGIKLLTVTKGSGADKAGLKKDDVITKIDNDEVSSPDALTRKIRSHKPGEKVDITYLRDGKSQKATAELGKMDNVVISDFGGMNNFNMNFDSENFNGALGEIQLDRIPRIYGQGMASMGGTPRLGLTVQDTDDGKGVKVLNVTDDANADKAGIKEDDVILEVDGKAVTSADEIARIMKDSKDKISVKFKYERDGKTNTVDVKVPRRLKTANL